MGSDSDEGGTALSLQRSRARGGGAAGAPRALLIFPTTRLFINTSITRDRALTLLPEGGSLSPGALGNATALPCSPWQGRY